MREGENTVCQQGELECEIKNKNATATREICVMNMKDVQTSNTERSTAEREGKC